MHHFVVKFSKFSSHQAARGYLPPNQNPADIPVYWASPMSFQFQMICYARQFPANDTIRCDTRCYFNVRSKADISQLNLPHGTDN